jgi:hydrogenase 3 maturation protease
MKIDLKQLLKGKAVIVGIGHPLRGDDALGPSLVKRLEGHINAVCIDAGSAPENYLGKIIKASADVVLFIDAVDFNEKPGFYKILEKEEILKTGFTTHDLSPKMLIGYLSTETKARIYLLGIQPKDLGLGQPLSAPVQKALCELENLFNCHSKKMSFPRKRESITISMRGNFYA